MSAFTAYFNPAAPGQNSSIAVTINGVPGDGETLLLSCPDANPRFESVPVNPGDVDTSSGDTSVIAANLAAVLTLNQSAYITVSASGNVVTILAGIVTITASSSTTVTNTTVGAGANDGDPSNIQNLFADSASTTPLGRSLNSTDGLGIQGSQTTGDITVNYAQDLGSNPMTGGSITIDGDAANSGLTSVTVNGGRITSSGVASPVSLAACTLESGELTIEVSQGFSCTSTCYIGFDPGGIPIADDGSAVYNDVTYTAAFTVSGAQNMTSGSGGAVFGGTVTAQAAYDNGYQVTYNGALTCPDVEFSNASSNVNGGVTQPGGQVILLVTPPLGSAVSWPDTPTQIVVNCGMVVIYEGSTYVSFTGSGGTQNFAAATADQLISTATVNGVTGLNVIAAPADVRNGVATGVETGSAYIPAATDVRHGVPVDAGEGSAYIPTASETLSGVPVDNTVGNVTQPAESAVLSPASGGPSGYGSNGTQYVGTATTTGGGGGSASSNIGGDYQ